MRYRTHGRIAAAVAAVMLVIAGCSKDSGLKTVPPAVKLYKVKSAKIVYDYSGAAKGTKTQLIANYGMYQVDNDNFQMTMGGRTQTVNTLTIRCDTVQYTIDMTKKEGVKSPIDTNQLRAMVASFSKDQQDNVNATILQQMGGKKIGTETIIGKQCDIYDLSGTMKIALWNGLVLRSEMVMGQTTLVLQAKSVETDVNFSLSDFEPPKDVKITTPKANMTLPPGHPSVDNPKGGSN